MRMVIKASSMQCLSRNKTAFEIGYTVPGKTPLGDDKEKCDGFVKRPQTRRDNPEE
jgi:hypothetical protein